jgi:hypothetical protein
MSSPGWNLISIDAYHKVFDAKFISQNYITIQEEHVHFLNDAYDL